MRLSTVFPFIHAARPASTARLQVNATFQRSANLRSATVHVPGEGLSGRVSCTMADGSVIDAALRYVERGPLGRRYHLAEVPTPGAPTLLVARDLYPRRPVMPRLEATVLGFRNEHVEVGQTNWMQKNRGWSPP